MSFRSIRAPRAARIASYLLVLSLAACGGSRPGAQPAPAGDVYSVRGEVVRLPTATDPQIWIRHEAVPDLRDPDGKTVGMEAMTMPFDLGAGAPAGQLAVGARVRFELHVDWEAAEHPVWVGGFQPLSADEPLPWDQPAGAGSTAAAADTPR